MMENNNENFAMSPKGLRTMLIGLIVIISGFILLSGGGVTDPEVFNYDMFDFRRLVAAPVVMVCGITIIIAAIMKKPRQNKE